MNCPDCGKNLMEGDTRCPYCGKECLDAVSINRQKRILAWVWSLAVLFGVLALFVFFGDAILQFIKSVQDKIGIIKPLSLLFTLLIRL